MFPQMASTTLENIQRILGKKFTDVILGVIVLSVLTSVCYYIGFLRSLGISMSDINMSIFELLDIQIITIIGIIYAVAYDRELMPSEKKYSNIYHDGDLSNKYKINGIIVVSVLFLLMIFAIYQGPYESDVVFSYLIQNVSLFFFPSVITGFLMWCILSFNKRSIIEFAMIFCSISIVSYTIGVYNAEDLILSGGKNEHSIYLSSNNKKMDVFLIKRFASGDLAFYKNDPIFIDRDSDRIVKFKKLSALTEYSTGKKSSD